MTNTLIRNTPLEEKRPTQKNPSLINGDLGMNGQNATRPVVTDLELECAPAMATIVLDRTWNRKIATYRLVSRVVNVSMSRLMLLNAQTEAVTYLTADPTLMVETCVKQIILSMVFKTIMSTTALVDMMSSGTFAVGM